MKNDWLDRQLAALPESTRRVLKEEAKKPSWMDNIIPKKKAA